MICPRSEIVEAQWGRGALGARALSHRVGPYSILNRSTEREVLEPIGEGHARWPLPKKPAAAPEFACQDVPQQMGDDRNLEAV
jgi:hypothetical protein